MPSSRPLALMPLTDQVPPLTVVVAAVVVLLAVSVITTEIGPALLPVPLTVTLPWLAMLMVGVEEKASTDSVAAFVVSVPGLPLLKTASY